ncbi:MAG: DUF308 domain-containing protein [Eubacterium sp.]|nr:DUF308 domain-containing protein [Eubacterium sp.]
MNIFEKIKNCLIGVFLLFLAVEMAFAPEEAYAIIPVTVAVILIAYGVKQLWFYFRMARFMVGGKSMLYQSIIILDIGLFTASISSINNRLIVLLFLLVIYAFTGVVDILRAFEAKDNGSSGWQMKLTRGFIEIAFVIALFIIGFIFGQTKIFVYGFGVSLVYSGVMRIVGAFRKTAIIYIQ